MRQQWHALNQIRAANLEFWSFQEIASTYDNDDLNVVECQWPLISFQLLKK